MYAIVLLTLAGFVAGPALGLARPSADLGPVFAEALRVEDLQRGWYRGFSFQTTRITETYDLEAYREALSALSVGQTASD